METSNQQRKGRRRRQGMVVALLGAGLGLGGCFSEDLPGVDDDGDPSAGTTTDEPIPGSTGQPTPGTTGTMADSSSGDDGSTTDNPDPTTDSSSSDDGEGSSSSTGETESDSTGVAALSVEDLVPGDLVVTEVMVNPHCAQDSCEWIEILNATDEPVDLLDLYIQDNEYNSGNQGRVTVEVIVPPGGLSVITRGMGNWSYMFTPDAIYGPNPGFNNGSPDRVVLRNSTEILDETASFFDGVQGTAFSLSGDALDAVSNDDSDHWCGAVDPLDAMTTIEYGSPGVSNPAC